MKQELEYIANKELTVYQILKKQFKLSERLIRKLKLSGRVKIKEIIREGAKFTLDLLFEEESEAIKEENIPLDILYEDDWLLIINKPSNMVVHPTCLHQNGTLANAVKYYLETKGEKIKIRFANRLDRDTSGVIILAKNEYIQEMLSRQMLDGTLQKEYVAIVEGEVAKKDATIDLPIKRDLNSIMLRTVGEDGERAITRYKVVDGNKLYTVLEIKLETGRTHQIRVHSKAIGHPIIGDDLYGKKSSLIDRQALHAKRISLIHPVKKERLEIQAPIPEDMMSIIKTL